MIDAFKIILNELQEAQRDVGYMRAERDALQQKLSERGATPDPRMVIEMIEAMAAGKKIDAIKIHRSLTGYGLKESKDAIETVMNRFTYAA